LRNKANPLSYGLTFSDHFTSFDLDEALGSFRLDPKSESHVYQQMSLPVMSFANHIQGGDLLIHMCGDSTWHRQKTLPMEGNQGQDMYYWCQH
jgi:hypothetical protein